MRGLRRQEWQSVRKLNANVGNGNKKGKYEMKSRKRGNEEWGGIRTTITSTKNRQMKKLGERM